jgi:hypothetical protein
MEFTFSDFLDKDCSKKLRAVMAKNDLGEREIKQFHANMKQHVREQLFDGSCVLHTHSHTHAHTHTHTHPQRGCTSFSTCRIRPFCTATRVSQ